MKASNIISNKQPWKKVLRVVKTTFIEVHLLVNPISEIVLPTFSCLTFSLLLVRILSFLTFPYNRSVSSTSSRELKNTAIAGKTQTHPDILANE